MRCRPSLVCTVVPALLCLLTVALPTATGQLTADSQQRVHPVLIRNPHNALLQVSVRSKAKFALATEFVFTLKGTTDLGDIESLQLFATGAASGFATQMPFGDSSAAGTQVTFRGNYRLAQGANIFWLSCRLSPKADLGHRVDAQCVKVVTTVGMLVPKDEPNDVRKRIGVALRRHNDDGVHTHRIPALATTKNGTLLCAYDMRRRKSRDLQEDIDIGLLRSTDGGRTWEAQRVIMDMGEFGGLPQEKNGVSDPGLIVDQNSGEIFCSAVWMWGKEGKHQWSGDGSEPGYKIGKAAQFLMVRSTDDGKTWSKPANMTRTLKKKEWWLFAPSPQQGITLTDGTLVMPSQGRDAKGVPFSNLMISRDHGKTWVASNAPTRGTSECQAVQLGDGSIMLNMRTERPTRFRTIYVTHDLGKTWQPHITNRKALIEPNCNGSTYRFDYRESGSRKHVLLFANPHSKKARDHHTIKVSLDDGKSWPARYQILLDEGLGRGYPSLSRIDDRHVGIVYEGSQADLVFQRLSIKELLGSE